MKKLLLLSVALALAGLVAFWIGESTRGPSPVAAQAGGAVFPKVEIHVRVDGIRGEFSTGLSNLAGVCEVLEFREGGDERRVRKIPGRLKWNDITLKRGYAGIEDPFATEMHKWYEGVKGGDFERKNGAIIVRNADDGTDIATYEFFEAWPCKWKGFGVKNTDAVFPVEEIGLVVNKVTLAR